MDAYYISTWQDHYKSNYEDVEPFTTLFAGRRDLNCVYVPGQILIGYELWNRKVLLVEQEPFEGAQEIVDGTKRGKVIKMDVDKATLDQLLGLAHKISGAEYGSPLYARVRSLVDNTLKEKEGVVIQEMSH